MAIPAQPAMAPGPSSEPFDPGEMEEALRALPRLELKGVFRRSSNYTFLAELCDERGGGPLRAVYKPAQGESPLWDFPAGTLYRREVATYVLSRHLGWPRVPPTVVREEAPHGVGALQLFVDADPRRHYLSRGGGRRDARFIPAAGREGASPNDDGEPPDTWIEVALFDVLINNADRKSGHCLFDREGRVWLIDHGLTFHVDPKLRTVIWDFAGQPVPGRLRTGLERAAEALATGGDLAAELGELLSRREVMVLRRRLAATLSPGWELPRPGSAWSVPWPPV